MPELPAPLPPAERTLGQLIAESIRAYGTDFWRILPIGLALAIVDQASVRQDARAQTLVFWAATPLFVAAYMYACHRVLGAPASRTAAAVAVLVWLPFPVLRALYIVPGLAWLAFIGLAMPAAMVERLSFRDALVRGRVLGTADYAHALASLISLVFVVGVAESALTALLHSQGNTDQRVGLFLSDLVLSPLLFLGGALLYLDQSARVGLPKSIRRRSRDAHFHPPVDADAAGRADPQVEP